MKHHSETHIFKNTGMKQSKGLNGDLKPEHKITTLKTTVISAIGFNVYYKQYRRYPGRCTITEHSITKTCLYSFDPLKPHSYIVKLGFKGVYVIFLISAQKHRLWVSHNLYFEQKYEKKYQNFLSENFIIFGGKIFCIFE